ncbi:MAG: helix-turn-helix transcriptional regulator [Sandaracinaceae bacterium]|nr:helix-turn-helix transcriptional regulator [Sandaracinaceae bacterium]
MHVGATDPSRKNIKACEFGLELLAQLLSEPDAPTPIAITAPQQRRIGDVLALMDESASSHLCLDDFAALARLSPYHFVRVFRAHVGTTPHQYLTRLRLMRSAEQLVESEDSVMEIALACGFRDLSNFMYAFKRAFGHSPGNYRTARKSKTH